MSDEKPEKKKSEAPFVHELLAPPLQFRGQIVNELRRRAERFYEEASLEEIIKLTMTVEAITEKHGMLSGLDPSR